MKKLDLFIDNKIVQNLFIWGFVLLILIASIQSDNPVLTGVYVLLMLMPSVYVNNLIVLPFLMKKSIIFLILFLSNIICFTIIYVFLLSISTNETIETRKFVNLFAVMVFVMISASAIKLARDSFIRRQQEKEAELKLLKAQLNPHFLFNTLNNLYGLSVVKSDKLPSLMLKLSDLLRYSLYETKEKLVLLEKEIAYLENYISLEKIRLEDKTTIQFSKIGAMSAKKIPPMLLIVFVENAFKHLGALETNNGSVIISIEEYANSIIFKCENTFDKIDSKNDVLEKGKSGIGLKNAKKRLQLIYPERHQLEMKIKENTYCVYLKIDL